MGIYKFEAWEKYGEGMYNGVVIADNSEIAEIRAKQKCEIKEMECPVIISIRETT